MMRARASTRRPSDSEQLVPTRLFGGRQHRYLEPADIKRTRLPGRFR